MRVIWGRFKGKKLIMSEGKGVRPLTDRVKMGIFNTLFNLICIEDQKIADVFCGTGGFGIEALSLGASAVTFIDRDTADVQKNLTAVGLEQKVLRGEAAAMLGRLPPDSLDLVFMDPPFAMRLESGHYHSAVKSLKNGGLAVIRYCRGNLENGEIEELNCFKEKVFGESIVRFYTSGL
ncbi:MAG: RsmD family RNA methyltransferase [Candidatus Wallbacteria bacterium]|nr:RsmD family RNA methyltransferase [Candidatus Wallbacteria bacterium]